MTFARTLMIAAERLAPHPHRDWARAMRAEFEAADSDETLSWAVGCMLTALRWRIVHESPIALGLVVAFYVPHRFIMLGMLWSQDAPYGGFMFWMPLIVGGAAGATAMLLSVLRPDRAAAFALGVPLVMFGPGMSPMLARMLADPFRTLGNNPEVPNFVHAAMYVVDLFWPACLGAALGWALARLLRRRATT